MDENQDLSPVNHEMIRRLVGDRRLIGVGDPNQNIYGFRGAQSNGMGKAVVEYKMTEMDLSISFRCPEAIVRNAWWHVPRFKWLKTGGCVELLANLNNSDIADSPKGLYAAIMLPSSHSLLSCLAVAVPLGLWLATSALVLSKQWPSSETNSEFPSNRLECHRRVAWESLN